MSVQEWVLLASRSSKHVSNTCSQNRSLSDAWGTQREDPSQARAKRRQGVTHDFVNYLFGKWCNLSHSGTYLVNETELFFVTIFCFLVPPNIFASAGNGHLKREHVH